MCDACPVDNAVVTVGVAARFGARFDGDMNLARSKGSVDGCLAGVVAEGNAEMEPRPVLSWNFQVSGTTIKI